jgi:hypothetical protein
MRPTSRRRTSTRHQPIATPPAADSSTTQAELAELHLIGATRTPIQAARAGADEQDETLFVFGDVFGDIVQSLRQQSGHEASRIPPLCRMSIPSTT